MQHLGKVWLPLCRTLIHARVFTGSPEYTSLSIVDLRHGNYNLDEAYLLLSHPLLHPLSRLLLPRRPVNAPHHAEPRFARRAMLSMLLPRWAAAHSSAAPAGCLWRLGSCSSTTRLTAGLSKGAADIPTAGTAGRCTAGYCCLNPLKDVGPGAQVLAMLSQLDTKAAIREDLPAAVLWAHRPPEPHLQRVPQTEVLGTAPC